MRRWKMSASDEITLTEDEVFYLYPELAPTVTPESVTLPDNLVGWLTRSSLAPRADGPRPRTGSIRLARANRTGILQLR